MSELGLELCIEQIGRVLKQTFKKPYNAEHALEICVREADTLEESALYEFDRIQEGYIPLDMAHLVQEVIQPLTDALDLRRCALELVQEYRVGVEELAQ